MLNSRNHARAIALVLGASFGAMSGAMPGAQAQTSTGSSSSQSPYIVPVAPGVLTKSILTVGDSVNNKPDGTPYRMVGIPDGMGAYDNYNGSFTLLMNHELRPDAGVVRAHGATGAFVSKWTIRTHDLRVLKGEDLIQQVSTWNRNTSSYNAPSKGVPIGRLCSADLPGRFSFYNPFSRRGYNERLFMNGEEVGAEGRGFAHTMDGTTYELPRLGKFSWENEVAHPFAGDKTVVVGTDDATPGEVYVYVGTKQSNGSPIDRAGLTNGVLYGVKVDGVPAEKSTTGIGGARRFSLHSFGNVENKTGAQLQAESTTAGVTKFLRPEDGQWNPTRWRDFYFVTTNGFNAPSRLFRMRFDSFLNPERGGVIEAVIDSASPGHQMLDNMTIDLANRALLQEDPGGQDYLARLWEYNLVSNTFRPIAQHDPARFLPGAPQFLTRDEESSGIIDVADILGNGWFIINVQAHYPIPGELVEGGQLLAMQVPLPRGARPAPFPIPGF